jgi:hypothetical protein
VSNLAICRLANGEPGHALQETQVLRELAPDWPTSTFYAALVLYRLGRHAEAVSLLDGLGVSWAGNGARCLFAMACIGDGRRAQALDVLASLESDGDPFSAGLVHAALGDLDTARCGFDRVEDWGAYWPTLSVHQYFPELWARMEPAAADARERVNLAWGLAADGSMDAA